MAAERAGAPTLWSSLRGWPGTQGLRLGFSRQHGLLLLKPPLSWRTISGWSSGPCQWEPLRHGKKIQWWCKEGNPAGLLHQDAERMMDRTMWPKTAIQPAGSNVSTVWDHTPRRQKQRWEIRQTRKGLLIPTIRNLDYFRTHQNSHAEKSFSLIFLGEPYLRHQWLTFCNPFVKKKIFFKKFGHTAQHIGSYIPDQGSNLCPLHWKQEILTTRPSGKSQIPEILCYKDSQPYIHLNNCNRDN